MITVIGSSNIDMIIKVDRIPRPGETVGEGEFSKVNGGKGANQAVGAARAGGQVTFISCVGDDVFGEGAIQSFQADGIRTDFVFEKAKTATGVALIFVDQKGENSIAVAPGANYLLGRTEIDQASQAFEEADMIVMQLEVPYDTVKYAIQKAKKLGKKVLLNPAPARKLENEVLSQLDILVVNETEAELISGLPVGTEEEIVQAAQKLKNSGPSKVILTLGSKGAYILDDQVGEMLHAFRVQAVDTTAAGDIFCGSLAVALTEGKDLKQAVKFASAASAISVTRLGAQPSAPLRQEIEQFLKN